MSHTQHDMTVFFKQCTYYNKNSCKILPILCFYNDSCMIQCLIVAVPYCCVCDTVFGFCMCLFKKPKFLFKYCIWGIVKIL